MESQYSAQHMNNRNDYCRGRGEYWLAFAMLPDKLLVVMTKSYPGIPPWKGRTP